MSNGIFIGLGTPKPTEPTQKPQAPLGLGLPKAQPAQAPAAAPRQSGIRIDVSAAQRIRKLLEDRGTPEAGLRIRVRGGGCTGLKYDMEFADAPAERDRVFEEHGVRIYVDPKSYIFLIGTVLSYHQGLLESGFKLENPNVKKSCGCGESFSV
ncbi:MAG TPA: iron-sulfur cluster assembly accessory protein [Fredinandcohnia sp.]|nr:iron-sulfur cluster assembly accessory protein [Fredinandcohnia sp.]